jgi:hypothetical protein
MVRLCELHTRRCLRWEHARVVDEVEVVVVAEVGFDVARGEEGVATHQMRGEVELAADAVHGTQKGWVVKSTRHVASAIRTSVYQGVGGYGEEGDGGHAEAAVVNHGHQRRAHFGHRAVVQRHQSLQLVRCHTHRVVIPSVQIPVVQRELEQDPTGVELEAACSVGWAGWRWRGGRRQDWVGGERVAGRKVKVVAVKEEDEVVVVDEVEMRWERVVEVS